MDGRIREEFDLIIRRFPDAILSQCLTWIHFPKYKLPEGRNWNKSEIPVCINIPRGYPGAMPYGIYVPTDLRCNNQIPGSFQPKAKNSPSFPGDWGMFSWSPVNGQWKPSSDISKGSNLYNFLLTFQDRFNEGV